LNRCTERQVAAKIIRSYAISNFPDSGRSSGRIDDGMAESTNWEKSIFARVLVADVASDLVVPND